MNTQSPANHLSTRPVVAFLDVHGPEVRSLIQAEAPEEIDFRMATVGDDEELQRLISEAEVFVGGVAPITANLIDAAPKLRLIHKWGVGVDKIDFDATRKRNIQVAISSGLNSDAVSEFTLLLILAVLRRMSHREDQLQEGEWKQARIEARNESLQLRGKVLGIIGFGNIGRQVAKRARAFDADLRFYDVRPPSAEEAQSLGVRYQPLEELLAAADIVSLHVPLVESTRNLLSRQRIQSLKPGAIVVNTARGPLIDELALADALTSGHLGGAGIDVYSQEPIAADNPLLAVNMPGLVLTPHMAGSAYDNVGHVARHIFGNVQRFLHGEPISARDLVSQ